ncbi:hypothetical protein E3G69_000292 [Mycobacteroides abscessus]|nr:hypothetical protein [Mycobacteroides abscessus]QOF41277.1 hypothetical protein E3G69_000292 [Mycobacteroides abscessus]QOF45975.1 hypothetical protein E3G70_000290 [Mycobacteroides abscessus]
MVAEGFRECLLPADMGFVRVLTGGVQCRKFVKVCGVLLTASTPVNIGVGVLLAFYWGDAPLPVSCCSLA